MLTQTQTLAFRRATLLLTDVMNSDRRPPPCEARPRPLRESSGHVGIHVARVAA
jgi:hypothetical protein